MALFEQKQKRETLTFHACAAEDINDVFFDTTEHAQVRSVDGRQMPVIISTDRLQEHSSHWEAGVKRNFDTGLYNAHTILYVKVTDYGAKPKVGKHLVLDAGTKQQRTFSIMSCEDEAGVYRMVIERVRQ